MNDGLLIKISVLGFVVLAVAFGFFFLNADEPLEAADLFAPVIALVLAVGAMFIVYRQYGAIKAGLPAKDEMAKKIAYKAGYYAFIVSIYASLVLMFYSELGVNEFGFPALVPRHYMALLIGIIGFTFIVSYLLLDWMGLAE